MRLAIMQPYFFPYIGYFQLIHSVEKFMLYENVSFRTKGWMTRNCIRPNNGEMRMICIPVNEKSSNRTIDEIKLAVDTNWKRSFTRTIYYSYKKASFFDETFPLIEVILKENGVTLHDFNAHSISKICNHLEIKTDISTRHDAYREMECEIRNKYAHDMEEGYDNVLERKTMRIIHICKTEQATTYHNAINGVNIYRQSDFLPYGIELKFIKSLPVEYKQFNGTFCPNLSIIDVLMHCGKQRTQAMLDSYETK